ncbi:hypothetical protein [Klebsiella pneumoniae IS10]|nr:hypothetical protein [Klebsiella pneumoniae IS10]CDL42609.1 hypothetical protein [Klebsiella pneumoniae ISC21]
MEKYRAPLSGTIQRPLPVNSARYAPEAAWERIVFGITTQKQSVIDCAGAI